MKEILERLEQKVDAMDRRFDGIDRRLDRMDRRFDGIDQRFDGIDQRFDGIDQRFDGIDQRFDGIDQRFDGIDQRFDGNDQRFAGIDAQLHKQGVLLEAVSSDVKMALEGIAGNRQHVDNRFDEVMRKLDERVQPVELATRHLARELASTSMRPRGRRKKA